MQTHELTGNEKREKITVYVLRGGNHARVPRRRLLREEVDHQDVATYP